MTLLSQKLIRGGPEKHLDASFNQASTTAAVPVLTVTQADTDQEFINLVGTSAASSGASLSSWTTGGAIDGFIRVAINGTDKWIPHYTAPTS